MKKNRLFQVFALGLLTLFMVFTTGCAIRAPYVPPTGLVFSDIKAPLDIEHNSTDIGTKQGKAESISILGLIALGDASNATAARNGNIRTIKHADYQYFNVLGIFQKATVVVHGD